MISYLPIGSLLLTLALVAAGGDPTSTPAPPNNVGTITDYIALLREFGFPVFVTVWFMWRIEKRIDRFSEQIEKLITTSTVMMKILDDKK